MGRGIAQVAAASGFEVVLCDTSLGVAEGGKATIAGILGKQVDKGKLRPEERQDLLDRIEPAEGSAELAKVDLAVEAVSENLDLKLRIFKDADAALPKPALLASNTSSISITRLAAATSRPDRVIGLHFMNPVPLMKLVEIVRGLPTSDATAETVTELAKRLGKTVVGARDIPGFIVNRMLIPLLNEACYGLYEGLGTAADIDTGVKLGLNHPMGPLELADLIGLDTCLAIAEVLHRELGDDKYRPCPLLRQYVAAGWLGRKSLRGFYEYDAQGAKK
jgi:3-hydroxybutyryl-CoA dehydrogenase